MMSYILPVFLLGARYMEQPRDVDIGSLEQRKHAVNSSRNIVSFICPLLINLIYFDQVEKILGL